MKALLALFGRSPFRPLQNHMETVNACVERLPVLFAAVGAGEKKLTRIVDEISGLEAQADAIKNEIRTHLPKSMFLPVDRRDLLEILTLQDFMADRCQDIGVTLTLRDVSLPTKLKQPLDELLKEVTKTCTGAAAVMDQLDELLETGFGGKEAEKVLGMIDKINTDETISDAAGVKLSRTLFSLESELDPVTVILWYQIFRQLGEVADLAEGVGNRLRLLLAR